MESIIDDILKRIQETINAGCPECGQRFDISPELLDWIQGGCAACRAKEAEKK
jgi:hypothetical protein